VATLLLIGVPLTAYGEGGVEMVNSTVADGETGVSPEPYKPWKFAMQFSKNVSFAQEGRDDAFVANNLSKVKLLGPDGKEAENYVVNPGSSQGERQVIYISTDKWLDPLAEYQIVVEPGLIAANGQDVSSEQYVITFKTSEQREDGFTVYQVVIFQSLALLVVVGIAVQIVRTKKRSGKPKRQT
jgi:hypothetical protein